MNRGQGHMGFQNRPGILGDPPNINSKGMGNFGLLDYPGDRNNDRMGILGKGPLAPGVQNSMGTMSNEGSDLFGQRGRAPGSYPSSVSYSSSTRQDQIQSSTPLMDRLSGYSQDQDRYDQDRHGSSLLDRRDQDSYDRYGDSYGGYNQSDDRDRDMDSYVMTDQDRYGKEKSVGGFRSLMDQPVLQRSGGRREGMYNQMSPSDNSLLGDGSMASMALSGNRNNELQGSQSSLNMDQMKMVNIQKQMLLQQQLQQKMQQQQMHQQQLQHQQQQMQRNAMRDSQLQMVNNLLQQKGMNNRQPQNAGGLMPIPRGNSGLLGNPRNKTQGLLGPKPNLGGQRNIPSLFDINTNKPVGILGKRGSMSRTTSNLRDQNKRPRRDSSGHTHDHKSDRSSTRGHDRQDRRRPSRFDSPSSKHSDNSHKSERRQSDSNSLTSGHSYDDDKSNDMTIQEQKEAYDPANPTTEELGTDSQKPDDMKEITMDMDQTVAEEMSNESKELSADPDVDSSKMDKGEEDSPQKQKTNYYCHACNVECRDHQGFANHMKGGKHRNKMASLFNLTKQNAVQIQARMKAEEHLRKIEGDQRRGSDGDGDGYRRPRERRPWASFQNRSGNFSNFRSPRNLGQRGGIQHSNQDSHRNRSREHHHRDRDEIPDDLGDLVTLDEVGFEDDSMDIEALQAHIEAQTTHEEETSGKSLKENVNIVENLKQEEKSQLSTTQQEDVDVNEAVGQSYVIQVSGYFCKLCHKFYNNETAAKVTHCMSQPHKAKYQEQLLKKKERKDLLIPEEIPQATQEIPTKSDSMQSFGKCEIQAEQPEETVEPLSEEKAQTDNSVEQEDTDMQSEEKNRSEVNEEDNAVKLDEDNSEAEDKIEQEATKAKPGRTNTGRQQKARRGRNRK